MGEIKKSAMVIHCATCITWCSHRRNHVKTDRKGYKKDVAFELRSREGGGHLLMV